MQQHILVPIDLDHEAAFELIFPAVKALARTHHAVLHFLTVVPESIGAFPYVPRDTLEGGRKQAKTQLATIADSEMDDGIQWNSEALVGSIAPTIVSHAQDVGAGLIAIASHNPKTTDILFGGVADRVLRRAPCSVLVLRAAGGWQWVN